MFAIPENWSKLTPKEKQEARLNSWVSAKIEFASPEAEQGYRQRAQMIKDAIQLKKPDDEYDLFISDPTNFFMRFYLPCVFGALGPWQMFGPWTDIVELPFTGLSLIPMGIPDVQQAFKTF